MQMEIAQPTGRGVYNGYFAFLTASDSVAEPAAASPQNRILCKCVCVCERTRVCAHSPALGGMVLGSNFCAQVTL